MTTSPDKRPALAVDALSLMRGGGVVVAKRLIKAMAADGIDMHLLISRDIPEFSKDMDGITVHLVPQASVAAKALLFRFRGFDGLCKRIGADAVMGFNYYTWTSLPQLTYHINVIPFISLSQAAGFVGLTRAITQKAMARRALRYSAVNLFESQHVLDLASATGVQIAAPDVAYIGVDTSGASAPRTRPDTTKLVCITSGAAHKRNDEIVEIARANRLADPSTELTFLGDPDAISASLSDENRAFAQDSDLVRFGGYVDRSGLTKELSGATALLTASALESFHMVAVEAMAAGCPAIAADLSSARESVGDAGMLYAPGDISAVLSHLQALRDPQIWAARSVASVEWAAQFDEDACVSTFVAKARAALGLV